jgi:hypothetical protein
LLGQPSVSPAVAVSPPGTGPYFETAIAVSPLNKPKAHRGAIGPTGIYYGISTDGGQSFSELRQRAYPTASICQCRLGLTASHGTPFVGASPATGDLFVGGLHIGPFPSILAALYVAHNPSASRHSKGLQLQSSAPLPQERSRTTTSPSSLLADAQAECPPMRRCD